jgi:hypothetical protein
MADAPGNEEAYRPEEVARRRDELARRMLNLPPQPFKPKTNRKNKVSIASDASPKKRERPTKANQT